MATITLASPEAQVARTDTLSISISPKSSAHIAEIKTISARDGMTQENSLWYRVHDLLYKGGILVAD